MNYKQLLREPMRITYIQEYEKDANLFFAGFEQTVTLKQLEEFFLKWGQVVSVKLSTDENKKSRGIICYFNSQVMDGYNLRRKNKLLLYWLKVLMAVFNTMRKQI